MSATPRRGDYFGGDRGDNDVVWILILLVGMSHRIHLQIY